MWADAMKQGNTNSLIEALQTLIASSIKTAPYELNGFQWCQMSHHERAVALGVSERTLRRIIGAPPGKPPFVSTRRAINGKPTTLLRVGEPGPQTPEDIARVLVSIWRKWLKKTIPPQRDEMQARRAELLAELKTAEVGDKPDIAHEIDRLAKTLTSLRLKETPHEYGCMVGLAEVWPDGMQAELFKMVLEQWATFMAGVKVAQATEPTNGRLAKPLYLQFPHISTIRRYHYVAVEMAVMNYQSGAKEPPAALQAINPTLWKPTKGLKPK